MCLIALTLTLTLTVEPLTDVFFNVWGLKLDNAVSLCTSSCMVSNTDSLCDKS